MLLNVANINVINIREKPELKDKAKNISIKYGETEEAYFIMKVALQEVLMPKIRSRFIICSWIPKK
jgi:hypothetical protein